MRYPIFKCSILLQTVGNTIFRKISTRYFVAVNKQLFTYGNICCIRQYIDYFIERPNVFSFFYSYRLHPATDTEAEALDYGKLYLDTYRGFVMRGVIKEAEVPIIAKTIIYTLHGLLALYFSDNGMTKDILYDELDKVTGYLLEGRNSI